LENEIKKMNHSLDEYSTLAHQALDKRQFDETIDLVLKAKQVYDDIKDTIDELESKKTSPVLIIIKDNQEK
jgi:vacuolar-type H+-ATPase subunit F/Vma7